jgi:hypothetical protein
MSAVTTCRGQLDEINENLLQVLGQVAGGVEHVQVVDATTLRPN